MVLTLVISISVTAQTKKWTLQECVNHAIENNISVKQTSLDTDLAKEDILSAKGNFLPNVNASASQILISVLLLIKMEVEFLVIVEEIALD